MSLLWDATLSRIQRERSGFEVKSIEGSKIFGTLQKLGWGMAAITVWKTVYMKQYLINTDRGADVLAHERIHVLDQARWNILFFLSYFLLLPSIFTMRAFWEWRAYKEDLRIIWINHHISNPEYTEYYAQWVASHFSSAGYGWMFPFKNFMYKKCIKFYSTLR
jgi:hypothetical protein